MLLTFAKVALPVLLLVHVVLSVRRQRRQRARLRALYAWRGVQRSAAPR